MTRSGRRPVIYVFRLTRCLFTRIEKCKPTQLAFSTQACYTQNAIKKNSRSLIKWWSKLNICICKCANMVIWYLKIYKLANLNRQVFAILNCAYVDTKIRTSCLINSGVNQEFIFENAQKCLLNT